LASFDQFIQSIDAEGNNGEVFEHFCVWFLKNDSYWRTKVAEVWLWKDWPNKFQDDDFGIDIVFRDNDGDHWAVQCKCYYKVKRTNYEKLATFLAQVGAHPTLIQHSLLMASTDLIVDGSNADVALSNREQPVVRHLKRDFENSDVVYPANSEEFHKLSKSGKPQPKKKHDDRLYQIEAVDAVELGFKNNPRGQLIMACGTGKTFVTLWIKERLESKTTLVLLPSLNLLGQTMREWTSNSKKPFEVLCVCSDQSVGRRSPGQEDTKVKDAPYDVTSKIEEIQTFLNKTGDKVIFCTYQSSELISEAQGNKSFDLVVCDEAHRCAGSKNASFTKVLDEDTIKARKRLFTTATPRFFAGNVKAAALARGDEMLGMENPKHFGPIFYKYSFGQAIKEQYLSDYQVVVVGVNSSMVKDLIYEREIVAVDPDLATDANSLASKIGLLKAMKDYGINRAISFHSKVKSAKDFSLDLPKIIEKIDPKSRPEGSIWTDYVSGKMTASARAENISKLKTLKGYDRGLLTNARCLSEGVDVPSLDAVGFIDPKSSQIDIIQAVGRAIRLSKGKDKGTIVIPVFIEDHEDPETAIEKSKFQPVWEVLKALRSHDEELAEELDQYRTEMGKSPSRKIRKSSDKIIVDLPIELDASFSESLQTRLVEATTASWEFWYGLLQLFISENQHCLVPAQGLYHGKPLGSWVSTQRTNKDNISRGRFERLNALGFVWNAIEADWEAGFKSLKAYQAEHGNYLVPKKFKINGIRLGSWVSTQRQNKETLIKEKLDRLNDLGFVWDTKEAAWDAKFQCLEGYQAEHGHCLIAAKGKYQGEPLGRWVDKQRQRRNNISKDKLDRLNELGFVWDPLEAMWDARFLSLTAYQAEHGNCLVPDKSKYKGVPLGRWVHHQRQSKDTLTEGKLDKLNSLNFVWNAKDAVWNKRFQILQAYHAEKGNCLVSSSGKYKGFGLKHWVRTQIKRKDILEREKLDKLNSLGFVWDINKGKT
jgi:superfamily II DNA or RNA helicase